eukprot:328734-Hanusia_phi.AAC.10
MPDSRRRGHLTIAEGAKSQHGGGHRYLQQREEAPWGDAEGLVSCSEIFCICVFLVYTIERSSHPASTLRYQRNEKASRRIDENLRGQERRGEDRTGQDTRGQETSWDERRVQGMGRFERIHPQLFIVSCLFFPPRIAASFTPPASLPLGTRCMTRYQGVDSSLQERGSGGIEGDGGNSERVRWCCSVTGRSRSWAREASGPCT